MTNEFPNWLKERLTDKIDELHDIVDCAYVLPKIKDVALAQIEVIEWVISLEDES